MSELLEEAGLEADEAKGIVATGMASFTPTGMAAVVNDPALQGLRRGIQLGFGRGKEPISNFPGGQTLMTPWFQTTGQMPRVGVDDFLRDFTGYKDRVARVTVKTGIGTDIALLEDLLEGIEECSREVEIVLSDMDPNHLLRLREIMRVQPNVGQLDLSWISKADVKSATVGALEHEDLSAVNEVALPIPDGQNGDAAKRIISAAELLVPAGKNLYLGPAVTQAEMRTALAAAANFNRRNGQNGRMTGFSYQ